MSASTETPSSAESEEERRKQEERLSAEDILEGAIDLGEVGFCDAAGAVGDVLGGLCDLG